MNFVIKKHIFLIFPLIIFVYLLNFYIDNFFISSFFALLMLEIIFRFILFLIYGKNYTNLFFPYALISHKKFGYTLRPNLKIKNMKGFLFDKFFFLPNVNPINHTLKENLENRLFFSVNNLGFRGEALKKNQ